MLAIYLSSMASTIGPSKMMLMTSFAGDIKDLKKKKMKKVERMLRAEV